VQTKTPPRIRVVMTWPAAALLMDAPFVGRETCRPHHGAADILGQTACSWQVNNLTVSFEAVSILRKNV
jgi:hypothetical protein